VDADLAELGYGVRARTTQVQRSQHAGHGDVSDFRPAPAGVDPAPDLELPLTARQLEEAACQVLCERSNRPGWSLIPLAALRSSEAATGR
jgi:predicted trehalose synthase